MPIDLVPLLPDSPPPPPGLQPAGSAVAAFTFADAIEHGLDYLGGTADAQALRDVKRSVLSAYREVANAKIWSYLYEHGRFVTDPTYTSGTVQYRHSSGSYPRELTLTGGTWPAYAADGEVQINTVTHRVAERKSDSVLTLDAMLNPGSDLPAGTPYTLYRDGYVLPPDFISQDTPVYQENFGGLTFIHPTDEMWGHRYIRSAGTPFYFTVTYDSRYPGRLTSRLFPYPDAVKTIDFIYHRRPRVLGLASYHEGTATVAASDPTTLTGNGAAFDARMAGSVVRLGTAKTGPTSAVGASPAAFETRVVEVTSATSLRLADAVPVDFPQVKYTVSDPVDVEPGVMLDAVLRGIEKFLCVARSVPNRPDAVAAFDAALREAKGADSRSFQGRAIGTYRSRHLHPKYMPAKFF